MTAVNDNARPALDGPGSNLCVTVRIGPQRLAIPIARIEDIFAVQSVTPAPLAPSYIAGLINLRGKIVTGILLSKRLGLPDPPPDPKARSKMMAIGIGVPGETLGLLVPNVGDVLQFPPDQREPVPSHLRAQWADFAVGVHQREQELIIELDVESIVALSQRGEAA